MIPGRTSRYSPALAATATALHMVHIGDTSNKLWHSVYDGTSWSGHDEEISGQLTQAAPALAAFNGTVYLVHLGDSSHNLWYSFSMGRHLQRTDKFQTNGVEKLPHSPSSAASCIDFVSLGERVT